MELALVSLKQILTMFCILGTGYFCYRRKLISEENNQAISGIVLNIVNPAVIFMSYQIDFTMERFVGLGYALLLSCVSFFVLIIISYALVPAKEAQSGIERIALIYSNCGFIGIPLIRVLIGEIGVFYLAAYLTVFNILLWTQGVLLMTGKMAREETIKALCSPCIISIVIGVIFFLLRIQVPEVLGNSLSHLAAMNTPLAMLVAGVTIARTDLRKALKKLRIYYVSFLKLLLLPVAVTFVLFIFYKMGIEKDIVMMALIATACPTGASGTLFAIRYHKDELYASELFGVSTVFSVLTIPLVILFSNLVGIV